MSTATDATIGTLNARHGLTLTTDYTDELTIPVLSGLQRQGDVMVAPAPGASAATPVPAAGCPVVRGENGGNTHSIYTSDAGVCCDTTTPTPGNLIVARLTVPAGAVAYLGHQEHGYLGIGPGTYVVRRQREQADELRMVAD